jgi:hypothetical protein
VTGEAGVFANSTSGFPIERSGGEAAEGETEMTYDVYQSTTDNSLRMATRPGAGLPNHVDPEDWRLMPAGTSQLIDDIDIDIADRGFCFFQTYIEMMASAGL